MDLCPPPQLHQLPKDLAGPAAGWLKETELGEGEDPHSPAASSCPQPDHPCQEPPLPAPASAAHKSSCRKVSNELRQERMVTVAAEGGRGGTGGSSPSHMASTLKGGLGGVLGKGGLGLSFAGRGRQ